MGMAVMISVRLSLGGGAMMELRLGRILVRRNVVMELICRLMLVKTQMFWNGMDETVIEIWRKDGSDRAGM